MFDLEFIAMPPRVPIVGQYNRDIGNVNKCYTAPMAWRNSRWAKLPQSPGCYG